MFSFFKRKAPAAAPVPEPAAAPETAPPVVAAVAVPGTPPSQAAAPETAPSAATVVAIPDTLPAPPVGAPPEAASAAGEPAAAAEKRSWFQRFLPSRGAAAAPEPPAFEPSAPPEPAAFAPSEPPVAPAPPVAPLPAPQAAPAPAPPAPTPAPIPPAAAPVSAPSFEPAPEPAVALAEPAPPTTEQRRPWLDRLRSGLRRTGAGIAQAFTGTRIDEALYEELEAALLMADAGLPATEHLLADLRWRVKEARATDPAAVKALLADAVADLLAPLERQFEIGGAVPTVVMVAGVNGAGKTTTIGKLTRHIAEGGVKVLLAAADTFRAAAKEQLAVWADRNRVEIVSQAGGDPAAVSFDAIRAGQARRCEVVIADTAGRLPTQAHLMDELKKIHRTIGKAMEGAPHEVLLVVDGNTGQNALAQVKSFDAVLGLTGLVVTKLDGTAKGGVLAAIALWSREREREGGRAVPVYFIGVGEKLEDLETFDAREFAQALLA